MTDAEAMELALAEAGLAAGHGDVPVGCVLVDGDGQLLGTGRNRRELDQDPTAHAEIVALRDASRRRGCWHLDDATAFVTLEPCVMCAGALVLARVRRVVFACRDAKGGALASAFELGAHPALNHRYIVEEGLLEEPCRERLQQFFRERRAAKKAERETAKNVASEFLNESAACCEVPERDVERT